MLDNELNDLVNLFFEPFDWDKKGYRFNRDEKDMSPYSIIKTKDSMTIVHNILGIDKKDIKLTRKIENGDSFICIEGKTIDSITKKEYSINSRFKIDANIYDLAEIKSTAQNGLLYIEIKNKKPAKAEKLEERIAIN